MKVGLALVPGLNEFRSDTDPQAEIHRIVETVHAARDAGFEMVRMAHHWLGPWRLYQPLPLFARLAPETGDMELVTGIYLLPQQNPFDVAEQVATLDVISNGRVKLGVGLGYRDLEFEASGIRRGDRAARLVESIEIMRRLWAGEEFTYRGKHFRCTDASIGVLPVQKPSPPVWIGASADPAARRAGRIGDGLFSPGADDRSRVRELVGQFRQGWSEAGKPGRGQFIATRYVHIAETRRKAYEEAEGYMSGLWENEKYRAGGLTREGYDPKLSFEDAAKERVVVGTEDEVIEGLRDFAAEFEVDRLFIQYRAPWWNDADHYERIAFLGREVAPHLR